jgi:UDP-N-acetylglucosamine/UDP-N-acetylgalactosamine diphosphorylase
MKQELQGLLSRHGQEHLLAFWDELSDADRQRLAADIRQIDFELIRSLSQGDSAGEDWGAKASRAVPPPAARLNTDDSAMARSDAVSRGREALDRGEIAVVIVAGGQGSRLGFEHPKGMYSIGPVSGASLFQILFEKVSALGRRHGKQPPLFVMTSDATHDETAEYLKANRYFGLPPAEVVLFRQGCMPAVDIQTGRVLLQTKSRIALSPDGHGGMLAALEKCGGLANLHERGIRHLFYCQVDNPLVTMCDAEFLGYHLLNRSQVSTQVIAKQNPLERVGNVVVVDGRMTIIEYSDLPNAAAERRNPDGSLFLWAGNTAIHLFDVSFLRLMAAKFDSLPFHLARKKVAHLDDRGNLAEPSEPNAIKFERFIFDLLPEAERAFAMEVDALDCFAPVKNAPGEKTDTPETVRWQMVRLHARWLRTVGATIEEKVPVEISPLFALDESDVVEQSRRGRIGPQVHVTQPTYFH